MSIIRKDRSKTPGNAGTLAAAGLGRAETAEGAATIAHPIAAITQTKGRMDRPRQSENP
jgi:hypothetical protein